MAVLTIAGSGRGAGKTAVGCALMAALTEFRWAAVKVTPHGHAIDAEIWEEHDAGSDKDTGRYLAAGAERAFLIRGSSSGPLHGLPDRQTEGRIAEVRVLASECDALLVESNQMEAAALARPGETASSVAVLSGPHEEWKASLHACLSRVDAVVQVDWPQSEVFDSSLFGKPTFSRVDESWHIPALAECVRGLLARDREEPPLRV